MTKTLIITTTRPHDSNYNAALINSLGGLLGRQPTVISYLETRGKIERINNADRIIIGGVPDHYSAETAEEVKPYLEEWLTTVKVPVLGICLGHQAIGLVFGATMRREEEIEAGICTAEIIDSYQEDPIFNGLGRHFEVMSFHWASISIEEASKKLIRLARSLPKPDISTGCENLVIRIANQHQQIYGAQFHPEESDNGKLFLRNFLELPKNPPR